MTVPLLGEREHRPEEPAVRLPVEHRVVHQLGRTQRCVLIQQHGAEHGLLGLLAPRRGSADVGISGRVIA